MVKKFFMAAIIIALVLSIHEYGFANDNRPAIKLNGTEIQPAAYIDGKDVYLPLRAVGEALGYNIQWSGENNTISVSKSGEKILIDLNNNEITANNQTFYDSIQNLEDTTYLREDFFSEYFGHKVRWDSLNGRVELESINKNPISIRTVKEVSETDKININIQYPQIDGLDDKKIQAGINAIFEKEAMEARNEGLRNADEMAKLTEAGYNGSPHKCGTFFNYRVKYNQNDLLSVVFTNYQYAGGAHGMTVQISRTFNLRTGEEYRLKDLVKNDADYVSLISDITRDEINKRVKEGILPDYLTTPFEKIKDDQDFYLSNNGLVIYFQLYEYFPYAAGIQEFQIGFSLLKGILKLQFSFFNSDFKLLKSLKTINTLNAGEIGRVILKGNPSTGYTWHYTIENSDIIKPVFEDASRDSEMLGAGNTYTWDFKALKEGQTRIVFFYYRDWEGKASTAPDGIVEYLLCVYPAASPDACANSIVYKNTQYDFSFSLPENWKGFSIITGNWEGQATEGPQSGETIETGPIISIRHPLWTPENQRQDIPIMIFTPYQWNSLQQEKFHIGAAPVGPSELGRNTRYIFALPARYNYAFPPGYEEVEKILDNNPLEF